MVCRRNVIAAAVAALVAPRSVVAKRHGAKVIVRRGEKVVAVDPRTGDVASWRGPLPATPAASPGASLPDAVATPVAEGEVGYWLAAPANAGVVFRLDTGAASGWWWRRPGGRAQALDLPADLEPAFPSGTVARWFHGATIDAGDLGAGTLRLMAVDVASGQVVLDHAFDRRLELAATKVSDDGAVVAHVQSATTGVDLWMTDLRVGPREVDATVEQVAGIAAASAIDLAVATDGGADLLAAGLSWSWPGAPDPAVSILWASPSDAIRTHTLPGELIGIVKNSP